MISSAFNTIQNAVLYQVDYHPVIDDMAQEKISRAYVIYARHLHTYSLALYYLREIRGLSHEIISRFQLGFADKSLCQQFRDVNEPIALRGMLQRVGVIGPKGHQIFLGSVIIPIKRHGIVVGGVGRRISNVVRHTSTSYPFHLIDEEALFNVDCLEKEPNCVVLYKSPMEALSALGQGIEEVISLVGNVDFSESHAKLLKFYKVKLVKIAFNQSPYYLQKISVIAQTLKRHRIRCKVVDLPDWQDINALCLYDPSGKSLHQKIRQAQPYGGH